mmetsp:Transcript_32300/g.35921  ORF Transcript_32300/g.35921 Transcript_32300/m.35921 type:complete len:119 (+) Transcript_32300:704-1060(+)
MHVSCRCPDSFKGFRYTDPILRSMFNTQYVQCSIRHDGLVVPSLWHGSVIQTNQFVPSSVRPSYNNHDQTYAWDTVPMVSVQRLRGYECTVDMPPKAHHQHRLFGDSSTPSSFVTGSR